MSDQALTAAFGVLAAGVAAVGAWVTGRRKGAADAAEGQARAEVALSTEARAFAADLRAELATERADRRRLEDEVEKLRMDLAAERQRCAWLEARVAELERVIRRMGQTVPGETPADGTPAVKPEKGDDGR